VLLCRDVMKTRVASCNETDSVLLCAQLMRDGNVGFLPVLDAEREVVGIVTDRDLALRVVAEGRSTVTPVALVMTRDVRVCRPEDDLQRVERKMTASRKSRLVVVEEGRCVGVISLSDVVKADSSSRAGDVLYAVTRPHVEQTSGQARA
jgi:CBS domain-containing protein